MITATSLLAERGLSGWLLLKDQLGLDYLGKDSSGYRHLGTSSGGKKYGSWPDSQGGASAILDAAVSQVSRGEVGMTPCHRAGRKTGGGTDEGVAGGEAREGWSPSPKASLDLRALSCKPFGSRYRTGSSEKEGDLLICLPS